LKTKKQKNFIHFGDSGVSAPQQLQGDHKFFGSSFQKRTLASFPRHVKSITTPTASSTAHPASGTV
jgi:hypothetical protein